jgi:phospholipid/cholesterol/gamma-HCH transport system ATP-binding protein
MGMLFQGGALFDSLTVWENVAFRLINADKVARREARKRAIDALERVRLGAPVADLYPAELSGGMQKRVALARAVVANPQVIFFDEPTTGLDPITGRAINTLITEQVRGLGCTAVTITHDLDSARTVGDEIAMLNDGVIVWRGPAADIDRSGNPYVDQFVNGRADGPIKPAIGPAGARHTSAKALLEDVAKRPRHGSGNVFPVFEAGGLIGGHAVQGGALPRVQPRQRSDIAVRVVGV